jgi:hypothetical protein
LAPWSAPLITKLLLLLLPQVLMVPFYPVPFVFFNEVAAQVAAQLAEREYDAEEGAEDDDSPRSTSL